jgi:hypothetical protein
MIHDTLFDSKSLRKKDMQMVRAFGRRKVLSSGTNCNLSGPTLITQLIGTSKMGHQYQSSMTHGC